MGQKVVGDVVPPLPTNPDLALKEVSDGGLRVDWLQFDYSGVGGCRPVSRVARSS
jgi:hypothetical protein